MIALFLSFTYLKLGFGDAWAGQVMVTEVRCWFWMVVTLSSDGNFGGDPPTGSRVTMQFEKCKNAVMIFFETNSNFTINSQVVAWMEKFN